LTSVADHLIPRQSPETSLTVQAALVRTLYGAISSLFVGVATAAGLAWWVYRHDGAPVFAGLSIALLLVGAGRAVLAIAFRVRPPADWPSRAAVSRTARAYALGAWAFTGLIGALGFFTLLSGHDLAGPLLVCTFVTGYTAAVTGRNAASVPVVVGQNILCLGPVAAAGLIIGDGMHLALALLMLLLFYSATEIALQLNRTAVASLVRGEENAALAGRLDAQNATLREREQELARQNDLFGAALTNMPHGLCMFDARGRLLVANDRTLELLGLPAGRILPGMSARRFALLAIELGHDGGRTFAEIRREYRTRLAGGDRSRMLCVLAGGRIVGLSFRAAAGGGAVVIFEDVTEEKRAEARIAHLASHDEITGLAYRMLFRDAVNPALGAGGSDLAWFCLDLDGFKAVNDSLGHPAGDALLRLVSRRLTDSVGEEALVARLGGDEFAMIVRQEDRDAVAACAERLVALVGEPYEIDGQRVVIGTSIGIAFAPADGPDALIKRADLALYRAKAEGRNTHRFFDAAMERRKRIRLADEIGRRAS
jgi:diguanylate cyclase (GGDEF)-like protein